MIPISGTQYLVVDKITLKKFEKNAKNVLTKQFLRGILTKLAAGRQEKVKNDKNFSKKVLKKFLTIRLSCGKLNKLSARSGGEHCTLKIR